MLYNMEQELINVETGQSKMVKSPAVKGMIATGKWKLPTEQKTQDSAQIAANIAAAASSGARYIPIPQGTNLDELRKELESMGLVSVPLSVPKDAAEGPCISAIVTKATGFVPSRATPGKLYLRTEFTVTDADGNEFRAFALPPIGDNTIYNVGDVCELEVIATSGTNTGKSLQHIQA